MSKGDPYANIRRVRNRCNAIDTHELLKQEIYKQSNDNSGFNTVNTLPVISQQGSSQPPVPPQNTVQTIVTNNSGPNVGIEDYEFYFDSTNRDTSSDLSFGELKWSIPILNNSQDLKNCVQVKLGTFFFPKVYAPVDKPEYFYYRRLFMEITSAPSSQSVSAFNNNKFHFEFDIENLNGQAVKLIPIKDTFFFQRPVSSMTEFNIRFTVPLNFKKVPLPADTIAVKMLVTGGIGYNPIRFQIVDENTTASLGPVGTQTPGIAVFLSNYTSNDATTNSNVNDTDGLYITNIIDSTTFEIGSVNGSAVTDEYGATLFIPKNRIAFSARFTTVKDQPTNYVSAVHD
ncbi:hypothetical protein PV-S19_0307 [Pacmanvirus S19]|nr:hypothetical protein PV-S19_0307 [Pacmanvirus S19]